ncbi:unnamed protein product [Phytomonas sp. EM1]|nr:unnamed protein product [Phytomonas sp. EM1]|eukprot:CCW64835.1 unnamed protein product [Phytomonas sp. isolate EM1]
MTDASNLALTLEVGALQTPHPGPCESVIFPFAVKIIDKKHICPTVLFADSQDDVANALHGLLALETQRDEYARRREHDWAKKAIATAQLFRRSSDPTAAKDPQTGVESVQVGRLAMEGSPSVDRSRRSEDAARTTPLHNAPTTLEEDGYPESSQSSFTQPERELQAVRERQRHRLLAYLPSELRREYTREVRRRRQQQCEVNILLTIQHPNVTRVYEVFDSADRLALLMERVTGGEALELLQSTPPPPDVLDDGDGLYAGGPLPEFVVKMIIVQVLEAVHYIHSMGIIHRDLKLENLLKQPYRVPVLCARQLEVFCWKLERLLHLGVAKKEEEEEEAAAAAAAMDSAMGSIDAHGNPFSLLHTVHLPRGLWPVVKITDFGLSHIHPTRGVESSQADPARSFYAENLMKTACGTPVYAAPEILRPELRAGQRGYSAAVDLFSVGVIAYALLTGRTPFPIRADPSQRRFPSKLPEIDYDAVPSWERYRRLHGEDEGSFYGSPCMPLPTLALAEPISCRGGGAGEEEGDGGARWFREARRTRPSPTAVETILHALRDHARERRGKRLELDLERWVVASHRAQGSSGGGGILLLRGWRPTSPGGARCRRSPPSGGLFSGRF